MRIYKHPKLLLFCISIIGTSYVAMKVYSGHEQRRKDRNVRSEQWRYYNAAE